MITIFNRRQLCATFSMEEQTAVREALASSGVDYALKVIDRQSPSALSDTRARTRTFGQNMKYAKEYLVYVRKADFARAQEVLAQMRG